jgi:hypothetical protein
MNGGNVKDKRKIQLRNFLRDLINKILNDEQKLYDFII